MADVIKKLMGICLIAGFPAALFALDFPDSVQPGKAIANTEGDQIVLTNQVLKLRFTQAGGYIRFGQFQNLINGEAFDQDPQSEFFTITLADQRVILCSEMSIEEQKGCQIDSLTPDASAGRLAGQYGGYRISAELLSPDKTVRVNWNLELRDDSNAIRQSIRAEAAHSPITIASIRFLSLPAPQAEVVGVVSGSPIVSGNMFVAYEHPIANNTVWDPTQPVNLALCKPVSPSGVYGSLAAEYAVDGRSPGPNSHWGCANLPVWLMVDLEQPQILDRIRLVTYYNGKRFYGYRIEASPDRQKWTEIVDATGNQTPATAAGYVHTFSPVQTRYLRVTITHNSEGNALGGHIVELEAFAPPDPDRQQEPKRLNCFMDRNTTLAPGQFLQQSSVLGVVPEGQLRRGFLYYLERERARPYHQYLHYNSWYHLNIGRTETNRMVEKECLDTIEYVGRELVEKRGVVLDGFVWDDGWDNFNSLWDFQEGFPQGFTRMAQLAAKYHCHTGVWLSPFGGYGQARQLRLEYGKNHGYEMNQSGFSLAGPVYYACFRDRCLQMMRDYGVNFFKFDGVGGGNTFSGLQAGDKLAEDVDAMLRLIAELRHENPAVYISATTGTWASPWFLFHADNIWRQGGDTGFHGTGPMREQWITYRDRFVHSHVVKAGPLYPLSSLMPHGLVVGDRFDPGKMERDPLLIDHEIWMMFACGANLLELYITPELLTQRNWDTIARAARWARDNQNILVDTHWIGGDPARAEIYGYASWSDSKGIMALRNPSDHEQTISLDLNKAFEIPGNKPFRYRLTSPQRNQQNQDPFTIQTNRPHQFTLSPFEVLVLDAHPL